MEDGVNDELQIGPCSKYLKARENCPWSDLAYERSYYIKSPVTVLFSIFDTFHLQKIQKVVKIRCHRMFRLNV